MLDHSGNLIDLPYIGCYSGCVKNYCYLFGTEVPYVIYSLIMLIPVIVIILLLIKLSKRYLGKE